MVQPFEQAQAPEWDTAARVALQTAAVQIQAVLENVRQEQLALQARLQGLEQAARARPPSWALHHELAQVQHRSRMLRTAQRRLRVLLRQLSLGLAYLQGQLEETEAEAGALADLWSLEVQEEERRRLAREIHDGPVQVLANAVFAVEYCQRLLTTDPQRAALELERLKSDLREGLADIRYCLFDLRPGPLAELGLPATLRRYAETFAQRFGLAVRLDLDCTLPRLSLAHELAIFRIVQEALHNVRKHSRASEVVLALQRDGTDLVVMVADNGTGFEVSQFPEGSVRHFGLTSMRERARLIRATLTIESAPGKGTRVTLRLPLTADALTSEKDGRGDGEDSSPDRR
jgi:two-component system sensor histidine kinase DegS